MQYQKRGRTFESEIVRKGKGKKVPRSGAGVKKHDVEEEAPRSSPWLIEAKSTKNRSYSVSLDLMNLIRRNAMLNGQLPRLDIQLDNGSNTPVHLVVTFKDVFDHANKED